MDYEVVYFEVGVFVVVVGVYGVFIDDLCEYDFE